MSKEQKKLTNKARTSSRAGEHKEGQSPLHPVLQMQRQAGNRAVLHALNESAPQSSPDGPRIQRASLNSHPAPTPGGLIVDDDAATMAPGQMRKTEFLGQLRSTVCATADEALKAAGQSTEGCPYIEKWLAYYEDQEPSHIERALRKYAPEATGAVSARDYIPAVSNRVRRAVQTWAETGEITGVPNELAGMMNGPGAILGAIGGVLGSIGSAIGSAFSSIGKALFKRREGRGEATQDPAQIQAQLTTGHPLDAGAKARMGAAFGQDFSSVRVHTGGEAAGLSEQLNARAFTVGSDIAFGAGEYQPGTLVGDALIAHELAHVVQQNGGNGPHTKGDGDHDDLFEEDADIAAAGAVAATWGGVQGPISEIGKNALPRMRSGLKLRTCKKHLTNKGTTITTRYSGHEKQELAPDGTIRTVNAPDKTVTEVDKELAALGLLSKVTKLGPPTNDYSCHGYTFLDGKRWLDDDQVPTILNENGYVATNTPVVGDIVIYRNGGKIKHSGVITEVKGTTVTKITSKWGLWGLYSHAPDDVPAVYGSWTAYHTTRPGGHRLRYER